MSRMAETLRRVAHHLSVASIATLATTASHAIVGPCAGFDVQPVPLHPIPSTVIRFRVTDPIIGNASDSRQVYVRTRVLEQDLAADVLVEIFVADSPTPPSGFTHVGSNTGSLYPVAWSDALTPAVGRLPAGTYRVSARVHIDDLATGTICGHESTLVVATESPTVAVSPVVEFYNAGLDHYFITQNPFEIFDLDTGKHPGWMRTGGTFNAYMPSRSDNRGAPTCRWYATLPGLDTHFFSASANECASVKTDFASSWANETDDAFEVALPDLISGACDADTVPVYRLWNGRTDSNHRYTTNAAVRQQMIAKGYVPEGYGPLGVAMCGLAALPSFTATHLVAVDAAKMEAVSMNNHDVIVGWISGITTQAAVFRQGAVQTLPAPPGSIRSGASGVNDAGVIVGDDVGGAGAIRWINGVAEPLPGIGSARAINPEGTVLGQSLIPPQTVHTLIWSRGVTTDITPSSVDWMEAEDLNELGDVVGSLYPSPTSYRHAYLHSQGTLSLLGTLGGSYSVATSVNARRQVVGASATREGDDPEAHAFVYENGKMRDLGTLGGTESSAVKINDSGDIIGRSTLPSRRGVLRGTFYSGDAVYDLQSIVTGLPPDTRILYVLDLNTKGQILALGCVNSGECRTFLLSRVAP